jgi:hypothetical protein
LFLFNKKLENSQKKTFTKLKKLQAPSLIQVLELVKMKKGGGEY